MKKEIGLSKAGTPMILLGTAGILSSIILNSLEMTGFSIVKDVQSPSNWINMALIVFFLLILSVGVYVKNKEF